MKYGLVVFKNTENIGDDIQSYSALSFLPKHIDYYIEREKIDLFLPNKKERVLTLINGWYSHSKINFIPSPYIYPIYISTHISGYNASGITTEHLNDYFYTKVSPYQPIGCRDHQTLKLLKKTGIDAYFSGCMTLTIPKNNNLKKEDYICIVDIDEKAEKYLKRNFPNEKIIKKTHKLNKVINSKLSWEERFKNVENLLETYQKAKLVITSRLHCALPCLALETNVLLLYDENKPYTKDRLSEYLQYLNYMSTEEFIQKGKEVIFDIKNSSKYKKIRNNLIKIIPEKIKEGSNHINDTKLPSLETFKQLYILPKQNYDELYKVATNRLNTNKKEFENMGYERDYWKNEFYALLDKSDSKMIEFYKQNYIELLQKYSKFIKDE